MFPHLRSRLLRVLGKRPNPLGTLDVQGRAHPWPTIRLTMKDRRDARFP